MDRGANEVPQRKGRGRGERSIGGRGKRFPPSGRILGRRVVGNYSEREENPFGGNPIRGSGEERMVSGLSGFRGKPHKGPSGPGEFSKGQRGSRTANSGSFRFGFKILQSYLSVPTDEVIMSICRNRESWCSFLKSDGKNLLQLVLQVLSKKVGEETTLIGSQIDIFMATTCSEFRMAIVDYCAKLDGIKSRRYIGPKDESPEFCLSNLLIYCQFMMTKLPNTTLDFLKSTVKNAAGACEECSFESLRQQFKELLAEIKEMEQRMQSSESTKKSLRGRQQVASGMEDFLHSQQPPEDFRELSIFPTKEELLTSEKPFLRPNKTTGAYLDSEHYLDVQFRLLREDFLAPLREGIQDFMKESFEYLHKDKKLPIGNIRLFPDVRITGMELTRDKTVYTVQLPLNSYNKVKWEKSKKLLTGSLLLFTTGPNYFDSLFYASVVWRKVEELQKGILRVTWESDTPAWGKDLEYLMVECETYFEPYRHTLETLKDLKGNLDNFPMAKFIVAASSDVEAPPYLENTVVPLKLSLKDGKHITCSPLLQATWPPAAVLGLDNDQFAAFKAGITQEFSIIQGPPGTGKTFLGLKIAEAILSVPEATNQGPILVVCYTNHALDQFLEGIYQLQITAGVPHHKVPIVRVGGRSQSDLMNDFLLNNIMRSKVYDVPKHYYARKDGYWKTIDGLKNLRKTLLETVRELYDYKGIVDFKSLKMWSDLEPEFPAEVWTAFRSSLWFGLEDRYDCSFANFNALKIIQESFEFQTKEQRIGQNVKQEQAPVTKATALDYNEEDLESEEDYDIEELIRDRLIEELHFELDYSKPEGPKADLFRYITSMSVSGIEDLLRTEIKKEENKSFQDQDKTRQAQLWNLKELLTTLLRMIKTKTVEIPDVSLLLKTFKNGIQVNLQNIPVAQRWGLYLAAVKKTIEIAENQVLTIDAELVSVHKSLQEIEEYGKGEVLRQSKVVGMTTTGAGKYNSLVKMMRSKVVIVEEAAEVLESHIVTCITKHCEHLILIGDHRQLRPSTTTYHLAKKYQLDISLFERMLNNDLNCYQLKTQHRMRPEVADLVVGTVYEELHNAPNVQKYPKVYGLRNNLFFLNHSQFEQNVSDSSSKSCKFEAEFLAGLCRYLLLQGYKPHQITVLTPYIGQLLQIRKSMKQFTICKGVRICSVDNFQGEENDIILLSLVRSNKEAKIGFLGVENRVCVALSRAKIGLYIVGNMDILSEKSSIWKKVKVKLDPKGNIGRSLILKCQNHETETSVNTLNDFTNKAPEGGCIKVCNEELSCTHKCVKMCHNLDSKHKTYVCKQLCLKTCPSGHGCRSHCYKCKKSPGGCPPCKERVLKDLPGCNHKAFLPCHINPAKYDCPEVVTKTLPCQHVTELPCHFDTTSYKCKEKIEKELKCLHKKTLECWVDPEKQDCRFPVEKTLPCLHKIVVECKIDPTVVKCQALQEIVFQFCKHKITVPCFKSSDSTKCKEMCSIRLHDCGHKCVKTCHADDDPQHLLYQCKKACAKECEGPLKHRCQGRHECYKPCPPCRKPVIKKLKCGHEKELPCYQDPATYKCIKLCSKTLNCLHKCKNLCYQECGPCQEVVKKRISGCKHVISVACCIETTADMCEALVPASINSPCTHKVLVPCKISSTVTPKQLLKYCTEPCGTFFAKEDGGCDHPCSGTCGSCKQGRLHAKCDMECGRSMVCGHICKFPCSQACPPCEQLCFMKCQHTSCGEKCGTLCVDCSENCTWSCKHKRCSKLCREPCDREPCNEPCNIKLNCGHECIGLCGEPCPKQCRVCDKDEVEEILFGEEDEPDARFVRLPDCGHIFEVNGLTTYMEGQENEIGMKKCPRCKTLIILCQRFKSLIQKRQKDTLLVKEKVFGANEATRKLQVELIENMQFGDFMAWEMYLPKVRNFIINCCVNIVQEKKDNAPVKWIPKKIGQASLLSIDFIFKCAQQALETLHHSGALKEVNADRHQIIAMKYKELFNNIMERKFPLSNMETKDVNNELDRIYDLFQIYKRRSHPRFNNNNQQAVAVYYDLKRRVSCLGPYNRNISILNPFLTKLDKVLQSGLGITENERVQILSALNVGIGKWFKCPNGHPYLIDNCGGAMYESVCPECGAAIGGGSHTLRRDNELATEMDGAVRPLWPTMLNR